MDINCTACVFLYSFNTFMMAKKKTFGVLINNENEK